MFHLGTAWWEIILCATVIYLFVVIGPRLTGRRTLGQLNTVDVVLILIIANAVQNAMIGPDTSLLGGLIAAATLLRVSVVTTGLRSRNHWAEQFFEGTPVVLINHGHAIEANLRRERIDPQELAEALHEHGLENAAQVKLCILEVDGSLSMVPEDSPLIHTRKHFRAHRAPNACSASDWATIRARAIASKSVSP
jgi:uncharacterized membrane protein YcaP (DUF421 family)